MKTRKFFSTIVLFVVLLASLLFLASSVLADGYSRLDFTYYYNDGSGDKYSGYVFAPTSFEAWLPVGTKLDKQPDPMGGAALTGYYCITGVASGYDSSYDAQSYVASYYDGDTGKTSYTLYSTTGQAEATKSLYVADRRYSEESGYVYDPSVPDTDAWFGDLDMCYSFSTSDSTDNNFLVVYVADLPYWNQPSSYPNGCAPEAGAIVLSYWDRKNGYDNLITTDWQTEWPDDTANSPTSYVNFFGEVATDMSWNAVDGTQNSKVGPGLTEYAEGQGYDGFWSRLYNVYDSSRSSALGYFTDALDAERPLIIAIYYTVGTKLVGHSEVARGYWNNGYYVANTGWGSSSNNDKFYWYNASTSEDLSYDVAYVGAFIDFYYQ